MNRKAMVDGRVIEVEASDNPASPRPARQSEEVSAIDFFNRFTDPERVAVMAACSASPALNVGLVNGLAAGSVTLTSEKMAAWMAGLVAAGAITEERREEILTP